MPRVPAAMIILRSITTTTTPPPEDGVTEYPSSYELGLPTAVSKLFRRKGGGGHGGGRSSGKGGSSGGSSKGSPASSHGASSSFTSSRGASGFSISKSGKTTTTATAYSNGGGTRITLGSGTSFPGRQAGGGDRVRASFARRFAN